jgi:hypothetical protein
MRRFTTAALLLLAAAPIAAQQPTRLTADDYARAERMLGANTAPLVSGIAGAPTWLDDGRFWYRTTTAGGAEFVMVDPARRTRSAAFDHTRLAAALRAATGGAVDPARLPFGSFEYAKGGQAITLTASRRRWQCDLQQYTCAPADSAAAQPAAIGR